MNNDYQYIITCPQLQEDLVAIEVNNCGFTNIKPVRACVYATGNLANAYSMCLHSRVANRVLLVIAKFKVKNVDDLYQNLRNFNWDEHFTTDNSLAINFTGNLVGVNNSHFGSLKAKDAIVDYMRAKYSKRPNIDLHHPDIRLHIHIQHQSMTLSLDLAGESLHKRNYLLQQSAASIKENLAAALLLRSNWDKLADKNYALVDPMCGGATFLIEGALIALKIAPNFRRKKWGFSSWLGHIPKIWQDIYQQAQIDAQNNLAKNDYWIRGFEADPRLIAPARANVERAGLTKLIKIYQGQLADFDPNPNHEQLGLIICNPPYGVRLGSAQNLKFLYQELGNKLRKSCPNWQASILCFDPYLIDNLGKLIKKHNFYNGALACKLIQLDLSKILANSNNLPIAKTEINMNFAQLDEGGQMFANRLHKNLAKLKSWLKSNNTSCYRLYDADMPEYNVAIDIYGNCVHIQEYAAPANIDLVKAGQRLEQIKIAVAQTLHVEHKQITLKIRMRQKDSNQYQKLANNANFQIVNEGKVKLLVNLTDYLDTGLFLDHRPLRLRIAREAKNTKFLNLFCYTGVATLHAISGGAKNTTSVDLSNTYLNWARNNLALNGYAENLHKLIRDDCMGWLASNQDEYDLIFIDPPTFANSKKRNLCFDIQQDHTKLLDLAMAHLTKNGTVYFSTNFQKFKLNQVLSYRYQINEISNECLDMDFKRNPKIHRVWQLKLKH